MSGKQTAPLHLAEEGFLGKGVHKAVYIDPRDRRRCIKVPYHLPDSDLRKEMAYRKALSRRHKQVPLLPAYYGTVETEKGKGYVFERIVDFNGMTSLDLVEYFERVRDGKAGGWPQPAAVLARLRGLMREEAPIVARHCGLVNILVQRLSPDADDFTLKIIDDIGSNATVPLLFYWDFLARRHAGKQWLRWMQLLRKFFPGVVTEKFLHENHLETLE